MDKKLRRHANKWRKTRKVSLIQKHHDALVLLLDEIKKNYEKKLKENIKTKNAKVSEKKINLEKKNEKN